MKFVQSGVVSFFFFGFKEWHSPPNQHPLVPAEKIPFEKWISLTLTTEFIASNNKEIIFFCFLRKKKNDFDIFTEKKKIFKKKRFLYFDFQKMKEN